MTVPVDPGFTAVPTAGDVPTTRPLGTDVDVTVAWVAVSPAADSVFLAAVYVDPATVGTFTGGLPVEIAIVIVDPHGADVAKSFPL